MIRAVLRVVIKYVFGSCMLLQCVVPAVASCAFMWAGILVAILKFYLFGNGHSLGYRRRCMFVFLLELV